MKYVLIVMFLSSYSDTGFSTSPVFNTKPACEAAATHIRAQLKSFYKGKNGGVMVECYAVGGEKK